VTGGGELGRQVMRGRRRGYSFSALSTSIYISLSLCASENSTQQPSNMEIAGMTASTGTAGIKVYSSGRPLQVQRTGEGRQYVLTTVIHCNNTT